MSEILHVVDQVLTVEDAASTVVTLTVVDTATVVESSYIPVPGPDSTVPGPPGPPGPSGSGGQVQLYTQTTATAMWIIPHTFGYWPTVLLLDNNDDEVIADLSYPDATTVVVEWAYPTTGTAQLT